MHSVKSRIREIRPADLPKVNGKKASPQDLLNLGIQHIEGDYYSCREQESDIPTGKMEPVVAIPGTVITEGDVQQRYDRLPGKLKVDWWRAMVRRTTGTGKNKRVELVEVDATEIQPTDDVESAGIRKHRWEGERE